jgi:pimeloyl-ACP methyl ester carboxylesterase
MSTFVLVHGAWQGASTWDLVVPNLRTAGHRVYVPILTGLGAHGHRLGADITLDHHIEDVLGVLRFERLKDVTLVGHSYAGMVISGVAEQVSAQLATLVYVDAFVPDDGQCALELLPAPIQQMFRAQAAQYGGGWRLAGGEKQLDLWGLHEGSAREFVRSKLCDFSLRCFEQPVRLPRNAAASLARTYIACVREDYPARAAFERFARRAKFEGWRYHELPTGHDCHVEMPDEFVQLLMKA